VLGVTGVKVVTFPNGPDLNQALAAGELDVATYGDTPALVARGARQPTRLIAQAQINLDAGILSKKGGEPASLADLAGKKVAVQTGSYIHRYLLGALGDAGIAPAEIIHIYSADVEAALERGDVDAAAVPIANVEALKAKGYPLIDLASKDHKQYLGTSATVVTERFLKAKPGIVTAWQNAQKEATTNAKGELERLRRLHGEHQRLPEEDRPGHHGGRPVAGRAVHARGSRAAQGHEGVPGAAEVHPYRLRPGRLAGPAGLIGRHTPRPRGGRGVWRVSGRGAHPAGHRRPAEHRPRPPSGWPRTPPR
jgi:hypothetical protein